MDEKPNLHNTGDWRQYSVEDGAQHQSETQANIDKETTITPGEDEIPKTPSSSCQKNADSIQDSEMESSPEKCVPKGADHSNPDDPNHISNNNDYPLIKPKGSVTTLYKFTNCADNCMQNQNGMTCSIEGK